MSRAHEVTISVEKSDNAKNPLKVEAICNALKDLEYEADPNWKEQDCEVTALHFDSETINVRAVYTDNDIVAEIQEAIWEANGEFCIVTVGVRDLDAGPQYSGSKTAYADWKAGKD